MTPVGRVDEIVRYPVKSMAGVPAASAVLGWHGLEGDRRFAFRRAGEGGGFPWLSATRLPELLLYRPDGFEESEGEPVPTHVRTPSGSRVALRSPDLTAEIGARCGGVVELMRLRHGVFDEATVSVIALATIEGIAREAGRELDRRRFRANVVVDTEGGEPFVEDAWIGGTLVFGDGDSPPAVGVTMRDPRCGMINLDPETAEKDARVMKAVVRIHGNDAGVYGTVVGRGTIRVGARVRLARRASAGG
jgi:hypothetical protein